MNRYLINPSFDERRLNNLLEDLALFGFVARDAGDAIETTASIAQVNLVAETTEWRLQ